MLYYEVKSESYIIYFLKSICENTKANNCKYLLSI